MVSKLRIIWKQTVAAADDAGVEGGKGGAVLTAMPVLLEQAEPSWRCAFLSALFFLLCCRSFWGCSELMHDCYLPTFCVRALSGNDYPETHP